MAQSMTGFGRQEVNIDNYRFVVEIKTVNHRFTEVYIRLPKEYMQLEENIRKEIQKKISRGRVDAYITIEKFGENDKIVEVDKKLILAYFSAFKEIARELQVQTADLDLFQLFKLQDVVNIRYEVDDIDVIWSKLHPVLLDTLKGLIQMRRREGEKIAQDLLSKMKKIEELLNIIRARRPLVVEEYRQKLTERIQQILPEIELDQNRLLTEIVIFAEKSDIEEELVRLDSHLDQLMHILLEEEPAGRKLDFLIQEMNREVNTIGSKAGDLTIAKAVVELKGELEKVREQIQNIE